MYADRRGILHYSHVPTMLTMLAIVTNSGHLEQTEISRTPEMTMIFVQNDLVVFRHRNNFFALFTSPRPAASLLFPVFSVSPVTNSSPFTFTSATPLSPPILAGPCFSHNKSHLDQQHHCLTPINTPQKDQIWKKNNIYLFQNDKKTEKKSTLQRLPRVTSSCLFLRVAPNCLTFQS